MLKRIVQTAGVAAFAIALAASPASAKRELQSLVTLSAQGPGQVASADQSLGAEEYTLRCTVNLSALANNPVVQVAVQAHDLTSDTFYNVAATPGLRNAGQVIITLGNQPGPLGVTNVPPMVWRVVVTVLGQSNSTATGTVGCSAI